MDDEGTEVVYMPDNLVEAAALEAHLHAQGIECLVVPYGDTAYPGIVDRHRPWGAIRVPAGSMEAARTALADWLEGTGADVEDAWQRGAPAKDAGNLHHWAGVQWIAGLLSLVIPGLGQAYNGQLPKAALAFVAQGLVLAFQPGEYTSLVIPLLATVDAAAVAAKRSRGD